MQAHKLVLLVLDFEGYGPEQIEMMASNARGLDPSVMSIETRDIGEWTDDHPLNKQGTAEAEFDRLFAPVSTPQQSAQRASVDTPTDEQISAIYRSTFPRGPYLVTPDVHKFARAILAWGSAGSGATDPVAEAFEKAARICDSSGHHWSGAPALAMFELAEKIRALAAPSPAPQGEQA